MCQIDKCVVAQGLKVVLIINLIIIDNSRMIQAFRFIEISKYDDGGQLMSAAKLCLEAVPQRMQITLYTCDNMCTNTLFKIYTENMHMATQSLAIAYSTTVRNIYCLPSNSGHSKCYGHPNFSTANL